MTATPRRRPLIGISGAAGEARTYLGPAAWQGVATTYVRAVQAAGGAPVVLGPILGEESASALVPRLDGLVLTGGGDIDPALYGQPPTMALGVDADRDRLERQLVEEALRCELPVLAICRGMQMLNVALGGTLLQHLGDESGHFDPAGPRQHTVIVTPGSLLERVTGCAELTVNSLHHQAVQELAPGLRVIGVDSGGVVEAVEIAGDDRVLGVQWHPELIVDEPANAALFSWVVGAAAQF